MSILEHRYASLVSTSVGTDAGLTALGDALRRDFDCDRVSIYLREKRGDFVSIYAEGLTNMTLAVKSGEGIVGKCIALRTPVISNHAPYDPDALCRVRDNFSGYATSSLLAAPIPGLLGRALGAVQLVNKNIGFFTPHDVDRLRHAARGMRRIARLVAPPYVNLWKPNPHSRQTNENYNPPEIQRVAH
ncbi:GAF domain-containing protein [Desulfobulbus alkaliphilus]|uniref:GAF domain-containing protein n=1 Tax=Desulfobulbus alkaliphilus TaxID=869814 RepID=UPI001964BBE8|nr:GAF domain-containing protein [Desulfobulbus alkaliphilus]MBM9535997.1 GAF domain-containing protein [Desulfobulbus alkaliphilus]